VLQCVAGLECVRVLECAAELPVLHAQVLGLVVGVVSAALSTTLLVSAASSD
jgi:hypothetical protein